MPYNLAISFFNMFNTVLGALCYFAIFSREKQYSTNRLKVSRIYLLTFPKVFLVATVALEKVAMTEVSPFINNLNPNTKKQEVQWPK